MMESENFSNGVTEARSYNNFRVTSKMKDRKYTLNIKEKTFQHLRDRDPKTLKNHLTGPKLRKNIIVQTLKWSS